MDLDRIRVNEADTDFDEIAEVDDYARFNLGLDLTGPNTEISKLLRRIEQSSENDDATQLSDLLGGPEKYAHDIKRTQLDRPTSDVSMDSMVDPDELASVDTATLDVSEEMAERIMESVWRRIEEEEKKGYHVDQLVLGTPQYKALTAWTRAEHGIPPEDYIHLEVIVVPGPQIHPVIPNDEVLWREL